MAQGGPRSGRSWEHPEVASARDLLGSSAIGKVSSSLPPFVALATKQGEDHNVDPIKGIESYVCLLYTSDAADE